MFRVDLKGLSPTQAVHRVGAMIDEAQAEYLEDFEIRLVDAGTDRETIDASIEQYRGELTARRNQVLARVCALFESDDSTMH